MWYPRSLLADTGLEKLKRTEWICQPLSDCQIVVMHLQSQENKVNSPNLWTIPQRIPCAWAKEVKVFGASVTLLHSCLPPFSVQFSWSATDPEFPPSLLLVDKWRYKSYPPLWGWSQQYPWGTETTKTLERNRSEFKFWLCHWSDLGPQACCFPSASVT